MKTIVSTLALAVATSFTAVPAFADKELSFNIFLPPNHHVWPVFQQWADDIDAGTNGEVTITFPAKSVAPPPGVMDAVRNGVADGGFMFNGFLARNAPATLISQMPWINNGDSAAVSVALWDTYSEHFAEQERLRGVELVSMFHLGPAYLCSVTDEPITSLEDMQSRRVWSLPGTIADTMADMDMAVVAGPAVQIQELVSRNTVDAHFGLTMDTIVNFGVGPYTKSCVDMMPAMQSANFSVFFNQRVWDRLSDEQRQVISDLSGAALAEKLGQATNEADAKFRAELEGMGMTFSQADDSLLEAIQAAAEQTTAKWAEGVSQKYGVDALQLVEEIRAATAPSE